MCDKCEKLEEYKKDLDKCKYLLRALIDAIDDLQDKSMCDNIVIEYDKNNQVFHIDMNDQCNADDEVE